jgi:hypothetical protein
MKGKRSYSPRAACNGNSGDLDQSYYVLAELNFVFAITLQPLPQPQDLIVEVPKVPLFVLD